MTLRIRVDDFPGTKRDEFDQHNLENFKLFHKVFEERGISYTLGVIPGHAKSVDLRWLNQQPNIEVALHGVIHNERNLNEFHCMSESSIKNAINSAWTWMNIFLEQKSITSYIPPHNTFDFNTCKVICDLGFTNIFGGPETTEEMKLYAKNNGLDYIHSEAPLEYGRSDELVQRGSVEYLKEECEKRDIWLTLHWPWEWNVGLDNLKKYLDLLGCDDVRK